MFDARVHWLQLKTNAVAAMLRGRNPLVEKPPCQTGNWWDLPELRRRFTEADWSRPELWLGLAAAMKGGRQRLEQRKSEFQDPQVAPPALGFLVALNQSARLVTGGPSGTPGFRVELFRVLERDHQKVFVAGARTIKGAGDLCDNLRQPAGFLEHLARRGLLRRFARFGSAFGKSPEVALVVAGWFAQQHLATGVDYDSAVCLPHRVCGPDSLRREHVSAGRVPAGDTAQLPLREPVARSLQGLPCLRLALTTLVRRGVDCFQDRERSANARGRASAIRSILTMTPIPGPRRTSHEEVTIVTQPSDGGAEARGGDSRPERTWGNPDQNSPRRLRVRPFGSGG